MSIPIEQQRNLATLVTGASGFIGRRLVTALEHRGIAVVALARGERGSVSIGRSRFIKGDMEKPETLAGVCDNVLTVFHLAGDAHSVNEGASASNRHHDVTQKGTAVLLGVAAAAGVRRFIFLSSVKAGGEGGPGIFDELSPDHPTTPYGCSRLRAEQSVLEIGREFGMHVCNLRLSMVYGAGMKGNLPRMITAIDRGRFPPLPELNNRRSMIWVEDVVQAALLAAERAEANGNTYIVTDGEMYSTRRTYEAICHALNKPIPRWTIPWTALRAAAKVGDLIGALRLKRFPFDSETLEKLLGSACYSSAKIARELGYRPRKKFEDVLPEILSGMHAHGFIHR